ncbi:MULTISPECIES: alpha-amylase family glycosyl hydrolase [Paenibacillus]|uniref:alpha-amylase family glycosyl hydrolase n=1 Tax=Paenibacillus TaxID=44249 RepID=UPI000FDA6B6A|nr:MULTISPECIES: alpha-amylase family glycosyl hydrolase [Paenibacillus]MDU0331292.1 alpha-amylase family glycosyl hydrolase [Paenibacillus sp. 3LSP]
MKPFLKKSIITLLASTCLFTAWLIPSIAVPTASAAPDTSVLNKQSFSTDVIYQIVTDRFADGDPSNNPSGAAYSPGCTNLKLYCGGDWRGIINKINEGYFAGMGVSALWISQPVENIYSVIDYSGVNSTSYHGYWARDFKRTNPAFGSMSDFQELINTAHANNIKIIIDFAPNHTSPASETQPSFAENGRLYDNGNLIAGYTGDTNGIFHHNQGTNFSSLEDGIYRNLYDLADINHHNNVTDTYFKDAIKLWLDMGIDGIRVDAVKHMPEGWQKNWVASIAGYQPVFTFGEWFLGVGENDPNNIRFANESGMSLLDFQFGQKVRQVFRDNTDTMYGLNNMLTTTAANYKHIHDQVTFIDNHDMDRFKLGNNDRRLEQALAFTLTSRGVPAIYYGTEQYMTGNGDPANRGYMSGFSTSTTAYQVIGKLAPLRKSNPALAYGSTQERWINHDVFIYERKFGNSVALVAINRNTTTAASITGLQTSLPAGTYTDELNGLLDGGSITVSSTGSVPAFNLPAGAVAVWQFAASESAPIIGNIGTDMGKAGTTLTIDGRGFGNTKGTVFFGTTAVTGNQIVQWEDSQIQVKVPAITPGQYDIKVRNASSVDSNSYSSFNLLTGDQVSVRFVINNANTTLGENVYLTGNIAELGNWDPDKAIGPFFNQIIRTYPTWYFDVSVPAGTTLEFKFIKKNGTSVTWEGGSNHSFTTPTNGVGTVEVDWQP